MKSHMFYVMNAEGEPVEEEDVEKWSRWMMGAERQIGKEEHGDVLVSTVFLGIDHNFGFSQNPDPILFETMVFGGMWNREQERYSTHTDAKIGHEKWVRRIWGEMVRGT